MDGCSTLCAALECLFHPSHGRAPDKMHIFISIMPISSPNPMFYQLLESSHPDGKTGFGEEIIQVESIKVNFTHFILSSDNSVFVLI